MPKPATEFRWTTQREAPGLIAAHKVCAWNTDRLIVTYEVTEEEMLAIRAAQSPLNCGICGEPLDAEPAIH